MTAGLLLPVPWPAPMRVRAFASTRIGGVSGAPFASLNLATGGGDREQHVAENVARLTRTAGLPRSPCWTHQVHGARVVDAATLCPGSAAPEADAVVTTCTARVCSVRTADCLPVLLCDTAASTVGAAHAGWRGLAAGVLEATVRAMAVEPGTLLAWLGPGIGPARYEVGDEVRAAFVDRDPGAAAAFRPSPTGRWLADLYALARRRLNAAGVRAVHGGGECTFSDSRRYFSYRRDGVTGRMACGIWLDAAAQG